jgi:hypothetical protein
VSLNSTAFGKPWSLAATFKTIFMIKTALICVTIFSFVSRPSLGQANIVEETITRDFFKTYQTDPIIAYANLFSKSKWIQQSDIETTKIKMKDFLTDMGAYNGYETITVKKAGDSFILKSFLVKYDRQPIRFTFILYKPSNEWKIQNFSYDTNIGDELEEAAKIDRLRANWEQ